MQMDRVFNISIIGKPHDALCASWDDYGGPRRHAIVAYQPGSTKVRVHLLRKGLDLKLVVPDLLAGDWAGDFPASVVSVSKCLRRCGAGRSFLLEWLLDGRDWQGNTVDQIVLWAFPILEELENVGLIFNNAFKGLCLLSGNVGLQVPVRLGKASFE